MMLPKKCANYLRGGGENAFEKRANYGRKNQMLPNVLSILNCLREVQRSKYILDALASELTSSIGDFQFFSSTLTSVGDRSVCSM